ncbi:sushi domain-containing protein 1 isoform X3 [Sebastes umbrosus]|uniref:sushi domain-containing protein 1 isoform X3 n=1 Tax=Sebastes umbrosus TaxID=72105 RepID=UPI0018A0B2C7|nr:sushi domain-containing protein 1 isoform X3 [Sebastes umbrosus]
MDERHRAMLVFFLLCFIGDMPAEGHSLDVCATCHANATCDDKLDGSGKVCNCKYGFVGNGRTFCQDKDECQIGASRICGHHTTCHNTYGSYYCKCLSGYSPSNNMDVFIPNDGTHCQDVDECRMTGLCGEGGQCRNLEGSVDCSCRLGYQVHNGAEPFHPYEDRASCKVVDCGQRTSVDDTVLLSVTGTTYGSVAMFVCDEGLVWRSGDNSSVCGADGLWRGADMVCEEVDCGSPPALPHSLMLWNKSSRMGTEVLYQCNSGYHNVGKGNVSICTPAGQWEKPSVLCQETLCGSPPIIESTEQVWDSNSTPGSTVLYVCKKGFYNKGGHNVSICNEDGQWTPTTLFCREILCGDPPILPHTGQVWNGSSTAGSTLTYYCKIGFYHNEGNNMSLCTINGYWTKPNISCKEVDCGEPPPIPHSVILWDNISTVGSQVVYQCNSGYGRVGEGNVSVCTASGEWDGASLLCQEINCQEPVFKPHAKMLWDGTSHIGSVVHYQCEEGYYTGSLRNYSVCGENGLWEDIDLCCEEVSCGPPLTLTHTNLRWDGTSRPGSVVLYECTEGFYQERETNISTCLLSGQWGEVSVKCKAKCGPAPFLANSEVMWHNRSVVIHRCVDGYHSWRGSNVSVCGSSGVWQTATLRCIEILCGDPPILPHTGQVWNGSSTAGSTLTYYCKIGFYHNEGNNMSLCTINGYWTKPNISCKEVDCGEPPPIPHSVMLWGNISTVGSQVVYQCNSGYGRVGEGNVSVCTASGEWDGASLLCQEINCQEPVFKPHAKMLWDGTSHIGSVVHYQCEEGYYTRSLRNYSVCGENGLWEDIDLCCEEVSCGPPLTLPHTNLRWDGTSRPGSVVLYECTEGFYQERETNISTCLLSGQWGEVSVKCKAKCGPVPFLANSEVIWHNRSMVIHRCVDGYHSWRGSNVSVCGSSGVWQTATLRCIEVSCGPPLTLPHTNLRWDGTSRPGSVVLYECTEGFYQERETNISTCLLSGQWGEVSVKCKAKCGPVPFLANSEVIWHNRSMVIHRCVDGYHSWRGSNVSVCGSSGVWQTATLRCIEIKPPVSHLVVLNEKCLHWRAEKHEEDTEVYKVTYIGSRDYQSSFHDTRKQFLSSKADQLELCLNLLPVTNYSISIIAVSSRFTITITTNTSLPVPPAPVVYYREFETPVPNLRLRRSPNTLDPISLYQVFVLPVEGITMFDCSSPASSGPSSEIKSSTEYITAQIDVRHVGTEMNFTVGDGLDYGGFFNAPLENGRNYYIILRAVSQWKSALKSSCVLWAKVRDTSYVLRVSSLVAAASIGLVALVILGRYSFTWYGGWYNTVYYTPC